jgi:UPF0271 protein
MIDFNADLGEGCPHDAELMQYVQSVNIACAAHAGSPQIMLQALQQAAARQLRVGAHPGYFDREGFGRIEQPITPDELYPIVIYQLAALTALAKEAGVLVSYVKPHGAMYHQCSRDMALADALIAAAKHYSLAVMGLPHSQLERACGFARVPYIREGFADRRYQSDGNLVPRTEPNAMLHDPTEAARQIYWLIEDVGVDSICVHGDSADAVDFLRRVQAELARSSP